MRVGLILLALMASGTFAGVADAQRYDPDDDRGPPPRYDRGPPPRDYDRFERRGDDYRPEPRFVCLLEPAPPYPGRRCETRPGRPGSPCHCNGPYVGHREVDRRY